MRYSSLCSKAPRQRLAHQDRRLACPHTVALCSSLSACDWTGSDRGDDVQTFAHAVGYVYVLHELCKHSDVS